MKRRMVKETLIIVGKVVATGILYGLAGRIWDYKL
jgi:hypothetical protein|tara:strand:- start:1495 stop:1599 length:105 start_codon:yes stop_codon:yes gene_type:complete